MALDYDNTTTLAISVTDWEGSKAWYQDVLGLKLLYEVGEIGWCELETAVPGLTIGLEKVQSVTPGTAVVPTLGVKDVHAARAALEEKSVRFDGETRTHEGLVSLADFFDPDGNRLTIAQSLS